MLQSVIGKIGIFMICAQAILQFRPKESYEKYLRLLCGFMILLQVIQPVSALLFGGSPVVLERSVQEFQSAMEDSMQEAARKAEAAQKQLEQQSIKEVQERAESWEEEEHMTESENAGRIEISPVEEIVITSKEEHE